MFGENMLTKQIADWFINFINSFKIYAQAPALRMLALGFSAGLPLLLVLGTLSFWLREAGIDRKTIGYLSWIGLAYGFKWVWAPLVDRLRLPFLGAWLGQRRSWMLLAQCGIIAGLLGMAATDPKQNLELLVYCAIAVAFCSATQDIALDALRIESADTELQAALSAAYLTGYRLAMIWAGAGALWLAARAQGDVVQYTLAPWAFGYTVMAASMVVGIVAVFFSPELSPAVVDITSGKTAAYENLTFMQRVEHFFTDAVVTPFKAFFNRFGVQQAVLMLALIATYRISDVVMGIMANPFYVDMGYTKDEVAGVTKVYGVIMTLVGAAIGGVMVLRLGMMRVLMIGAVASAATNLLFAWLATRGHDYWGLVWVISADNLASGIASAAFIAYMSGLTTQGYSATQYALFSSLMVMLPKYIAGFSGVAVDAVGYSMFFVGTAAIGLPVLVLVWLAGKNLNKAQVCRIEVR